MTRNDTQRGITLIETLVAASLLFTLVGGVAYLFLLSHRFAISAEQSTAAVAAAAGRLEALGAVPWAYDLAGGEPEVAALALSPAGTLDLDTTGFHDRLDSSGAVVEGVDVGQPAFVRRWALLPLNGDATSSRGIEVCVFAWPAAVGAAPLVCLASARTRQP